MYEYGVLFGNWFDVGLDCVVVVFFVCGDFDKVILCVMFE